MTNEQKSTLEGLLRNYAEAFYDTSSGPTSRYNDLVVEENLAKNEVFNYVNAMLDSASKDGANVVLDKSFWNA